MNHVNNYHGDRENFGLMISSMKYPRHTYEVGNILQYTCTVSVVPCTYCSRCTWISMGFLKLKTVIEQTTVIFVF